MNDEEIIVLDNAAPAEPSKHATDDPDPLEAGRCRIYNSSNEQIGCKNVSSKDACAEWARWKGAYGYGWAPGYRCD